MYLDKCWQLPKYIFHLAQCSYCSYKLLIMFVPKVTKYDLWPAMSQLHVRRVYTYNGRTETTSTKKQWQKIGRHIREKLQTLSTICSLITDNLIITNRLGNKFPVVGISILTTTKSCTLLEDSSGLRAHILALINTSSLPHSWNNGCSLYQIQRFLSSGMCGRERKIPSWCGSILSL